MIYATPSNNGFHNVITTNKGAGNLIYPYYMCRFSLDEYPLPRRLCLAIPTTNKYRYVLISFRSNWTLIYAMFFHYPLLIIYKQTTPKERKRHKVPVVKLPHDHRQYSNGCWSSILLALLKKSHSRVYIASRHNSPNMQYQHAKGIITPFALHVPLIYKMINLLLKVELILKN